MLLAVACRATRMTTMVTVQLDEDVVAAMRLTDEPIDRLAQEAIVLELYRRGTISSGRAAILLGMPRIDFIRYSGQRGIPYIDMTPEEWDAEMRAVDELTRS